MNAPEVPCPHCSALNSVTAKKCRSCGRSMIQGTTAESEQQSQGSRGGLRRLLGLGRRR